MGRKGSNLTRLSATHVEAFEQLLPPELKATLADLIATSPEMKKWSDRGAKKDAWMALKKVAADACTEIEIDYFRARSGSPLIVMPDMRIQPPDRADIVKRAAAKAGTTEESAATAVAFGDKTGFVPLPPTIEDSHGRTVAHPVNGESFGFPARGTTTVNFRQTIAWVAEHGYRSDVGPKDAPNGTAWGMLCWFRRGNESQFYSQLYKCLVPNSSKIASDEERRGSEAMNFNDIRELTMKAMATDGDDVDDIAVSELVDEEEAALVAEGF